MTQAKSLRLIAAVIVATICGAGIAFAANESVIELTQTGCQFLEPEQGYDHGFKTKQSTDCVLINAETGGDRLTQVKPLILKPGRYIFRVTNKNVPYQSDLSELDLLVIQIDGLHVGDHVLMAAIGVDGNGDKHVLAVVEGATENTVVVQALIDNLLARGLDPTLPRLFIVDGAKALSQAIRNTFGVAAAIQRCQVHKGRNIIERLPQHLHASVKKALRQAWDQDDANKAERLLRNLARRLEHEEPGVSGSILEGLEEILTVIRLGLPHELRRSLACTNIVENALGTVRQVTRNVKRWRHAEMALRWTAAGLLEARKTFRRLKAYRQLPILRNALQEHLRKAQADSAIETIMKAA